LAEEDEKNCLKKCVELFSDFYVMNKDLFSLGILNSSGFRKPVEKWNSTDDILFERMSAGISAACYATRKIPLIRYQSNSTICDRLARRISERFNTEIKESPNAFV